MEEGLALQFLNEKSVLESLKINNYLFNIKAKCYYNVSAKLNTISKLYEQQSPVTKVVFLLKIF